MSKKLYRSTTQKVFSGVCGGVAEYFSVDVTLVRLIWAVAAIPSFGTAIIVYILAAIIVPVSPYNDTWNVQEGDGEKVFSGFDNMNSSEGKNSILLIIGLILVVMGALSIFKSLFPIGWNLIRSVFWPAVLIVVGGAIIYSAIQNRK